MLPLAKTHDLDLLLGRLGARAPSTGALILGGQRKPLPGGVVLTYADGTVCAPEATDRTLRTKPPQNITLHTTTGEPRDPPVSMAAAFVTHVCNLARYQANTDREVSWDFTVATLGMIVQQLDPLVWYSWQAGNVNGYSLGIETEQGPGGVVYCPAIRALVALVDTLTRELGIMRQVPAILVGGVRVPDRRVLARFGPGEDGHTWWGAFGHRNVTSNRGPGDPGDATIQALLDAGYWGWDLATWEDYHAWYGIQRALGVPQTGQPGPATVAAMKAAGYPHGMNVWRPGD